MQGLGFEPQIFLVTSGGGISSVAQTLTYFEDPPIDDPPSPGASPPTYPKPFQRSQNTMNKFSSMRTALGDLGCWEKLGGGVGRIGSGTTVWRPDH